MGSFLRRTLATWREVRCFRILFMTFVSFLDAAKRGLKEELDVDAEKLGLQLERLLPMHLQQFVYKSIGRMDNEFVELWKVVFDGEITVDGVEVELAEFVPSSVVQQRMAEESSSFTSWFISEMKLLMSASSA